MSIVLLYNLELCGFKIIMISFKHIFVWWHKYTFSTFFKTLIFGKFVGRDHYGNKYYKNKKDERWVIYSDIAEASKIPPEWYSWIHHTIDTIPKDNDQKYDWQKKHKENMTGTPKRYRPNSLLNKQKNKRYETWKN